MTIDSGLLFICFRGLSHHNLLLRSEEDRTPPLRQLYFITSSQLSATSNSSWVRRDHRESVADNKKQTGWDLHTCFSPSPPLHTFLSSPCCSLRPRPEPRPATPTQPKHTEPSPPRPSSPAPTTSSRSWSPRSTRPPPPPRTKPPRCARSSRARCSARPPHTRRTVRLARSWGSCTRIIGSWWACWARLMWRGVRDGNRVHGGF
ncbi:hypothetical protein B0H14DRAFT_1692385 [Mycena olivaceomarginata]|nr:hypothetical protein B0H14DRAFT_1692385 [Mycena olivaceomarginata]